MEMKQAVELLTILADGINPITGEVLPEGDSCNQLEVVRALNLVLRNIDIYSHVENNGRKTKAGHVWTKTEESMLCEMYDSGLSKEEIAEELNRSSVAIAARLVALGKIEKRKDF